MPKNLEIERKFLLEVPTWSALSELLDNVVDIKRISQTYLNKEDGDQQSGRVRKTISGLSGEEVVEYMYNQKKFVEHGVNEEHEHVVTKKEYDQYLKNKDKDTAEVSKIRFVFKFNDQTFELDIFREVLKGLAILEIELKDKNDKVELPKYLKIIKEVTGISKFNNFNLAKLANLKELE